MPTRVTISVPDDIHKAIQAARGRFLLEDSADVPYSTAMEFLVREAVALLAKRMDDSYAMLQKARPRLKKLGVSPDDRFHPGLTEEDKHSFRWQLGELEEQAIGYTGDNHFEEVFVAEMTPILLKLAKARYQSLMRGVRSSRKKSSQKSEGAPVAQGESTAFGKAEEGVGHPPGAPQK